MTPLQSVILYLQFCSFPKAINAVCVCEMMDDNEPSGMAHLASKCMTRSSQDHFRHYITSQSTDLYCV